MSKKRKEPLQSSTLLNFFTPGASSTSGTSKNKKRPKTFVDGQRSTVAGIQSTRFEVKEEREDRKWKPQDADVIVIESDDENEVDAQLVDGSSDVEVVMEARHCRQERSKQPATEAQTKSGRCLSGAGEPSVQNVSQECELNADVPATGSASRAPKDDPDEWELAMGDEELDDEFVPNGLLGNSCEDLTQMVGEPEELEGVEQGFESCPMCRMAFFDLDSSEAQAHVNACLDAPAPAAPSSSSSSAPKPLGRLSSFFTSEPSSSTAFSSDSGPKSKSTSAFSVIMSGNAERERAAWAEAQAAEDRNFRPTKVDRRKAPFYKVMTGMPIAVDAFRYGAIPGVQAYFLTHAHSDHYTNLSSNWKNGPIYCSETTANLVVHMLSVDRKWIRSLPMDRVVEVPNTGGVKVTLIDANHCPGSCLFLFEGPQTINAGDSTFKSPCVGTARMFRYLHCGDFRASPQHALHSAVHGRRLDTVYLDTTYLNPKYCFPPQPLVVSACAELARRIVNGESLDGGGEKGGVSAKGSIQGWMKVEEGKGKQKARENGDVLVVVGTYSIGKERIVKAIAKVLNTKVYCDARKTSILRCQDDPELHALLTNRPLEAGVHVVPLSHVSSDQFKDYMARWKGRWSRAVAFRPTGWTYSPPAGADPMPPITRVVAAAQARDFTFAHLRPARNSTAQLMQYGVPYSEHSSFAELACFALSIDCARMIATVNVGSATGRAKMQKWVERWDAERKRRKEAGLSAVVEYRQLDYW